MESVTIWILVCNCCVDPVVTNVLIFSRVVLTTLVVLYETLTTELTVALERRSISISSVREVMETDGTIIWYLNREFDALVAPSPPCTVTNCDSDSTIVTPPNTLETGSGICLINVPACPRFCSGV